MEGDPMSAAPSQSLIALAAGGTGGHVFPAQALAEALIARGHRLALLTDSRGGRYGGALGEIEHHAINSASPSTGGLIGKLSAILRLIAGTREARRLLRSLKPGAVVGFGGYASVPPLFAATRLRIPTVIHEQNAVLGRANRLLASRVNRIATSFPATERLGAKAEQHVVCTGNPVRPAIAALGSRTYEVPTDSSRFRLLIVGGSQGAQALSRVVPEALARMPDVTRARLSVVQQCRPEDLEAVRAAYRAANIQAECDRFFDDMAGRLAAAHLVIARSGASTVAELAAAGRPAILVPYPHAMDDHQSANARALERAGAAWLMPQASLTPDRLRSRLELLMAEPHDLAEAAQAARRFAQPDAAGALATIVESLLRTGATP
ncbi:MAG: undecaprenyldiphospho-muramoylpentapeptide beta-N-acetylglucosaminyltransferase [Alphaproteobacteria bacterium]|nr:undecaprenyldiphospho-muramoylpentapeptide beta-N-acetylglucosaminyltransferase [Alphaproteobacteria bacterium]